MKRLRRIWGVHRKLGRAHLLDSSALGISDTNAPPRRGCGTLGYYRLYFIDRSSGHIDHFREYEAEDDQAALAVAERWREDGPMELWNRDRKLKVWADARLSD